MNDKQTFENSVFPPNDSRAQPPIADQQALGELRRSVAEITRVLYVRRWLFFVPLCLVMTCAFAMSLQVARRYERSTTFERRDDPVLVNLPRNEGSGAFATFRRTLAQDITNSDAIESVVRTLKLVEREDANRGEVGKTTHGKSYDEQVRRIASGIAAGLGVRLLHESEHLDVIEIVYTNDEPDMMSEVLNEVRETYVRRTQRRINDLLQQTKDWFETEQEKRRTVVEALETDLIQFRTDHRGLDPMNPEAVLNKLSAIRSELTDSERQGEELKAEIEVRQDFIGGDDSLAPDTVANLGSDVVLLPPQLSAGLRRLNKELRQVDRKIEDLKAARGMTDRHPDVLALLRQRENVKRSIDRQAARDGSLVSVNGVTDSDSAFAFDEIDDSPLAAGRTRAAMEMKVYQKLLQQNESVTDQLRVDVVEYEGIQHSALVRRKEFSDRKSEVDRARRELELYQGYAEQVGRVLAAENSQRGVLFERIKLAGGSNIPSSPRLSTVVVLALTIGVAISVVLVLLSELFDGTIRTRRQVTANLGLPILESIGEIVTTAVRRKRMLTRFVFAPAISTALIGMVVVSGLLAFVSLRDRSLYARAMRMPQTVWHSVVSRVATSPPVAQANNELTEHRG